MLVAVVQSLVGIARAAWEGREGEGKGTRKGKGSFSGWSDLKIAENDLRLDKSRSTNFWTRCDETTKKICKELEQVLNKVLNVISLYAQFLNSTPSVMVFCTYTQTKHLDNATTSIHVYRSITPERKERSGVLPNWGEYKYLQVCFDAFCASNDERRAS